MSNKTIHTLKDDIYNLFRGQTKVSEENLSRFKEDVGNIVRTALEEAGTPRKFELRMSNVGAKDRKLFYDSKTQSTDKVDPEDLIKFLYGHIIEHLVLFLAKEAGHEVSNEQEEVTLNGVPGHKDCHIDGVVCDIKSASSYSFNKFVSGAFPASDPFGYATQLKGYYEASKTESDEFAWVVVDKQYGKIHVALFDELEFPSTEERIGKVKTILASNDPPERCYSPEMDNSGNIPIPKECEWCPHFKNSNKCWGDLRVFHYSTGPRFYIEVNKQPRVPEITEKFFR